MKNLTIYKRELITAAVSFAAVAAGALLMLQTDIDVRSAEGAEVIIAAPGQITGVSAPSLSNEVRAAEREFVVPVLRAEIRLPEPPAIAAKVDEIRDNARSWLGDGAIAAPGDEILVEAPEVVLEAFEEASLEAVQLRRPELPSPPPVR